MSKNCFILFGKMFIQFKFLYLNVGEFRYQFDFEQLCFRDVVTWMAPSSVQSEPTSVMLC